MLPVSGYLGTCFILVPWSKQKKCHLFIIWSDKGRKRPSQLTIMDKTKVIYRIFDFERQLETYSETYNYLCPSGKHPKPSQPGLCPSLGFGHSVERGPGLCKQTTCGYDGVDYVITHNIQFNNHECSATMCKKLWPKKSIGHAEKDFLLSPETQNPERHRGLFLIIHMI